MTSAHHCSSEAQEPFLELAGSTWQLLNISDVILPRPETGRRREEGLCISGEHIHGSLKQAEKDAGIHGCIFRNGSLCGFGVSHAASGCSGPILSQNEGLRINAPRISSPVITLGRLVDTKSFACHGGFQEIRMEQHAILTFHFGVLYNQTDWYLLPPFNEGL